MDDAQAQTVLRQLTNQIRGDARNGMPPQPLTTDQLDDVLEFVRDGQLSPNNYRYFLQNSSQSSNKAYRLSPTDIESYKRLNPKTPKEAVRTAEEYRVDGVEVPDHLVGRLVRFYDAGMLSEENYRRYILQKEEKKGHSKMADKPTVTPSVARMMSDVEARERGTAPAAKPAAPTTAAPATATPAPTAAKGEEPADGGTQPLVKIDLGSMLKRLHVQGALVVSRNTAGRVKIINQAYDESTATFNIKPGVYKIIATSTDQTGSFVGMFRARTARKALLMYLNTFVGPTVAKFFEKAAMYKPTTNNGAQQRRGFFGRMWHGGNENSDKNAAQTTGYLDSVKDVTQGVVSFWMKYQLVASGGNVGEAWIKVAEPGKPLLTESEETPCEENGWHRISVDNLMQNERRCRTVSESFVRNVETGNEDAAIHDLKKMLESKVSRRLAAVLNEK